MFIGEELYNNPKNDDKGCFDSDEESDDDESGIGDHNMRADNDNESSEDEDEEDVDETDVLKTRKGGASAMQLMMQKAIKQSGQSSGSCVISPPSH